MIKELVQYELEVLEPITRNKKKKVIGKSIVLHNAGEQTATINGNLTLVSGATIQFNASNDREIYATWIRVNFSGSGTTRLEIVTSVPIGCDYSNYNPR